VVAVALLELRMNTHVSMTALSFFSPKLVQYEREVMLDELAMVREEKCQSQAQFGRPA
jgi:hypothetical protein